MAEDQEYSEYRQSPKDGNFYKSVGDPKDNKWIPMTRVSPKDGKTYQVIGNPDDGVYKLYEGQPAAPKEPEYEGPGWYDKYSGSAALWRAVGRAQEGEPLKAVTGFFDSFTKEAPAPSGEEIMTRAGVGTEKMPLGQSKYREWAVPGGPDKKTYSPAEMSGAMFEAVADPTNVVGPGLIKKPFKAVSESKLPNYLLEKSAKALKGWLRPTGRAAKELEQPGKLKQVSKMLAEENAIGVLGTPEKLVNETNRILETSGKTIGSLYKEAQAEVFSGNIQKQILSPYNKAGKIKSLDESLDGYRNYGAAKLLEFRPLENSSNIIRAVRSETKNVPKQKSAVKAVIDHLNQIADNYHIGPQGELSIQDTHEVLKGLNNSIKWDKTLKQNAINEGLMILREIIAENLYKHVEYIGHAVNKPLGQKLLKENKRFSLAMTARNAADKRAAQLERSGGGGGFLGLVGQGLGSITGGSVAFHKNNPLWLAAGLTFDTVRAVKTKYGEPATIKALNAIRTGAINADQFGDFAAAAGSGIRGGVPTRMGVRELQEEEKKPNGLIKK